MLETATDIDHLTFEILNRKYHDRLNFDCGDEKLNNYIRCYALQQQNNSLTVVYVATNSRIVIPKPIYGFYTLSAAAISFVSLPDKLVKNVPDGYKIPSVKIGRLVRDLNKTNKGFGAKLLVNALGRIEKLSKQLGISVVDIDAKNGHLAEYYKKYGFVELLDCPNSLVMSCSTIAMILDMATQESKEYEEII